MGSRNPPPDLHDPALRAAVQLAFDATWKALQAREPFRDFDKDNELKTELSQKLSALAADGVTDTVELREWALEGLSGHR
jgi:hypothetical protein